MKILCICSHYCSLMLLGVSLVLLSACGQYGDLYLPDEPAASQPVESSASEQQLPVDDTTPLDNTVEQPEAP